MADEFNRLPKEELFSCTSTLADYLHEHVETANPQDLVFCILGAGLVIHHLQRGIDFSFEEVLEELLENKSKVLGDFELRTGARGTA